MAVQERAAAPREHRPRRFLLIPHLYRLGPASLLSGDLGSVNRNLKGVVERTDPGPAGECRAGPGGLLQPGLSPADTQMGDLADWQAEGVDRTWTREEKGLDRVGKRSTRKGEWRHRSVGGVEPPQSPWGECGEAVGLVEATSPSQASGRH